MHRKNTLLLFLCFCTISLFAQNSFSGTTKVRIEKDDSFPRYIQFEQSQQLSVEECLAWMRENFKLGANTTFEFLRRNDDQLGNSHHRFQQLVNGTPVIGGIYILHEKDGVVHSMNGELFQFEASAEAIISKQNAIEQALRHYPAEKYGWETTLGGGQTELLSQYPDPELVWVPENLNFKVGNFKLAYKMDVYAVNPEHRAWVFVDAQSGKVVAEENRICHIDVEGTVQTVLSGERVIYMDQVSDDTFRLRETTRGNGIVTLDMQNSMQSSPIDYRCTGHP
jgi:Zn-dependent metalloprotease